MLRPLYPEKWHNRRQHGPHIRFWRLGERFFDSSGNLTTIPRSFNQLRSNDTDQVTATPVACYLSVILYLFKCDLSKIFSFLTVHLGIFLANNQFDAEFFLHIRLFRYSTCFEQPCAHHQEIICINTTSGICHSM